MSTEKKVKDVMVGVFEYPHIPYWFTIRQAIGIIRKSFIENEKSVFPYVIFIFNEKYDLLGTVTPNEIIKGLEPKIKPFSVGDAEVIYIDEESLTEVEAGLFTSKAKELAEKPVSEIMVSAKIFVSPNASVAKAAFMMVHHNMEILPVLENKKFVGVVRMTDVFNEISKIVTEEV